MKCRYCNKELPKIIDSKRDVCNCENAQKEWNIQVEIQILKKQLAQLNKELSDLKDTNLAKGEEK